MTSELKSPNHAALLAGRKLVISGGSGDLGQAIARACHAEGAQIAIGYHSAQDAASDLAASLGAGAAVIQLDVTQPASIAAAVQRAAQQLGGIDGWVNAAGVVAPGLLVSQTPEQLEHALRVNLLGSLWCCQAVLPELLRQPPRADDQRGVLLNLSSVAAARPFRGQVAYAASKGGVEAMTRALAVEYARKGIRCVCLAPGSIQSRMLAPSLELDARALTERIPARRLGTPEEVGRYAAFLLSDQAAYVNGTTATIDGGYVVG